uniref:Cystatin n=1 Tax=Rhipicephalus appendiculatus TaxID=34631 RepID=A0A131YPK4_RHIAP
MAAIKPTCTLLLLGVWAVVLLGSCYAESEDEDGFKEQDPEGSPTYMKMAHYAVSTQTKGKKVYDTAVELLYVATKVLQGSTTYDLDFSTAPSNCTIGQVPYSAEKCRPAGPENKTCTVLVHVVLPANTTTVEDYICEDI